MKLTDSFSRVFSLRKRKLIIYTIDNALRIPYSLFNFKSIDFANIKMIQLKGNMEHPTLRASFKLIYCDVDVVYKSGKVETILFVNTRKIIKSSDRKIEVEVYSIGKKVVSRIAAEVKTNYKWLGFKSK